MKTFQSSLQSRAVVFRGEPGRPCANVVLRGVRIADARYDLPAFSALDWSLGADRPDGVEFAAALIVPAGDEEDYLELLSYLAGLNFEAWRVK